MSRTISFVVGVNRLMMMASRCRTSMLEARRRASASMTMYTDCTCAGLGWVQDAFMTATHYGRTTSTRRCRSRPQYEYDPLAQIIGHSYGNLSSCGAQVSTGMEVHECRVKTIVILYPTPPSNYKAVENVEHSARFVNYPFTPQTWL